MKINKIKIKFNIFALLITLSVFLLMLGAKNIAYAEEAAKETEKTEETTETEETDETKDAKEDEKGKEAEEAKEDEKVKEAEEAKEDGFEFKGAKLKFITGTFDGKDSLDIDFPIEMKDASVEYIDEAAKIISIEKKDFNIKNPNIVILHSSKKYYVITAINAYKDVQDNIIDKVNIESEITYDKTKLKIKLKLKDIKDANKDIKYSICYTSMDEKPFQTPEAFKLVDMKYRLDKHCIIPDGYYYQMNPRSVPYKESYFFLQGAIYIANTHLDTIDSKFSQLMTAKLIDDTAKKLNDEGYYPIPYRSEWLKADYNIEKGYFDTRWNLDYAYICLRMYEKFEDEKYLELADKVLSYYKKYANQNAIKIPYKEDACLVMDYGAEYYIGMTHSSLNHHLMGLKALMYEDLLKEKPVNTEFIKKMLNGVEATCNSWIKKNGDLEYAIFVNGTYGLKDYPDLTLNDLRDCQALHEKLYKSKNASLETLIASKQAWYDNIYKKQVSKKK